MGSIIVTSGANGWQIPSVQIFIAGTQKSTISDFEGKFTIKADSGEVISFYVPDHARKNFALQNQKHIDIMLQKNATYQGGYNK